MATLNAHDIQRNLRAVEHAIAQQVLEGLTVSEAAVEDMRRAALGELDAEDVIANIHLRFEHAQVLRR